MKKLVVFLLLLVFVCPLYAAAAEDTEDNYLGLGALIRTRPYQDVDTETFPVPIIYWREGKFFTDGRKAGYDVYDFNEDLGLDLILSPRLLGYDDEDSTPLNGMEDRDWSLDGGARLRWDIPDSGNVAVNLMGVADLLSKHQGQEFILSAEKKIEGDIFQLTPSAGIKWQSEDMIDYYYGVRNSEITATRAEYEPDSSVNYYVDVNFNLGLSRDWVLVTIFNYEFLGKEITDSPIVDDDFVFSSVVGVIKKF